MRRPFILLLLLFFISALSAQDKNPLINSAEYIQKGIELHDKGKYKEAVAMYSKIEQGDTNYYQAVYEMAYSLSADSQLTEAVKFCKIGLKENNEYWPQLYTLYGNLLDDSGQPEKALQIFDSGLAMYPAYTQLHLNKGTTYLILKKYKEAEAIFKQCILINPYESSAHYKLGLSAMYQGKIVEAFLCYMNYMLLQPGGKFQSGCITQMSNISKNTDVIQELISKRADDYESPFSLIEKIILSKIALDKNYKTLIKLDDQITRQIQVMCEKLEYDESSPDFWMQYYVPLLINVFKDKKFEAFAYRMFSGVEIDAIQDYLKKNKSDQQDMVNYLVNFYNQIRATRELNYTKRTSMQALYQFEDGKLYGKGKVEGKGDKFIGDWEFCYSSGNIRSRGKFNNDGGKEGEWRYYHYNGLLRGVQYFKNNIQDGKEEFYYENGVLSSKAAVKDGEADGEGITNYLVGSSKVIQHFKAGKLDGNRKTFYSNGNLKSNENYKLDSLDGAYATYYNTGILESTGTYNNGKLEGPFKSYHENGKLAAEGQYKNGLLEGLLKRYHENGQLKSKENYLQGEMEGEYTEYYDDGALYFTSVYKKGKQEGSIDYLDRDGKKFSAFSFDNGVLKSAKYFDKSGKEISSSERKAKKMDLTSYSPEGFKRFHAVYNDKGLTEGVETSYFTSGKIVSEVNYDNGVQTGRSVTYFPNGNKDYEVEYADDSKHGYSISWYMHGPVQLEGWYQEGSKQGTWLEYDEMGNLHAKTTYLNDDINGYREEYHPNGKKTNIAHYHVGWIQDFIQFDTTGKEINRCEFKNGSGKIRSVMINGKLYAEGEYKNGDLDGPYKFYYPDGTISSFQFYKGGLLDSTLRSYYHGGKVSTEGNYKLGNKVGVWKHYLEDGKLDYVENYVDGSLHGKRTYYFENGKPDTETEFDQGNRRGWTKRYDPDGSLLYQMRYDDDVPEAYTYLDKTGKLVPEIPIPGGNGKVKSYFANGNVSAEMTFADGKLNGPNTLYYSNGKLRKQSNEDYNQTNGVYKYYFPNGQIELDYTFLHDNLHGSIKIYNEKGILLEEGTSYNGLTHGSYKTYDDTGKLKETRIYFYGDLLEIIK